MGYDKCLVLFLTRKNKNLQLGYGVPRGIGLKTDEMIGQKINFADSPFEDLIKFGEQTIVSAIQMDFKAFSHLEIVPFAGNIHSLELLPLLESGSIYMEGRPAGWNR